MPYVITCADDGVQINEGTRLGIAGCGLGLEGISEVVAGLKTVLDTEEANIAIAPSQENDWTKEKFELADVEQADATMQQRVQALAEQEDLDYAGFIKFTDPEEMAYGIKAHMVRPKGMHIGNQIAFTLGGGEFKYHLGYYLLSAEWISEVDLDLAKAFLDEQIEFYRELAGSELPIVFELAGDLPSETAERNHELVLKLGYEGDVIEHEE
jgi:hypothetical protein